MNVIHQLLQSVILYYLNKRIGLFHIKEVSKRMEEFIYLGYSIALYSQPKQICDIPNSFNITAQTIHGIFELITQSMMMVI